VHLDSLTVAGPGESGRGQPHSKTWRKCVVPLSREASWSAAVLCRFASAPGGRIINGICNQLQLCLLDPSGIAPLPAWILSRTCEFRQVWSGICCNPAKFMTTNSILLAVADPQTLIDITQALG